MKRPIRIPFLKGLDSSYMEKTAPYDTHISGLEMMGLVKKCKQVLNSTQGDQKAATVLTNDFHAKMDAAAAAAALTLARMATLPPIPEIKVTAKPATPTAGDAK